MEAPNVLTVGELVEKLADIPPETLVMYGQDEYPMFAYGVGCGHDFEGKETVVIF